MPGEILSIVTNEARRARETVAGLDGVRGAILMGDSVNVVVDDAARRASELAGALGAAGVPSDEIECTAPSIEYKASRFLGLNPEIIDKGDEVDISSTAGVVSWFRTIDAFEKAAQANIDAARAAAKAESEKLEKYR